jgi:uncharacterized membrane protein YccC
VFANFINSERLIHSIKTTIACIIGYLLTIIIHLPANQWVVITIIVIMCSQIYVGSVMSKAYARFLGTLAGCLFAAFTLTFIGNSDLAILLTISVAGFAFSYIATKQESLIYPSTLGAVTTALIMLGQTPTLLVALERFLEISLGILIATLISQFVLPIHARTHLRKSQAATLGQLRDYYIEVMINRHIDGEKEADYHELDENIIKSLMKQRSLAKESVREPLGLAYNPAHFSKTLYCEREMLRAISFMQEALAQVKRAEKIFSTLPSANNFNNTIINSLNTIINVLEADTPKQHKIYKPSLNLLKEDLLKNLASSSREELLHMDGFLFSAEVLTNNLLRLAQLYNISTYGDEYDGSSDKSV